MFGGAGSELLFNVSDFPGNNSSVVQANTYGKG